MLNLVFSILMLFAVMQASAAPAANDPSTDLSKSSAPSIAVAFWTRVLSEESPLSEVRSFLKSGDLGGKKLELLVPNEVFSWFGNHELTPDNDAFNARYDDVIRQIHVKDYVTKMTMVDLGNQLYTFLRTNKDLLLNPHRSRQDTSHLVGFAQQTNRRLLNAAIRRFAANCLPDSKVGKSSTIGLGLVKSQDSEVTEFKPFTSELDILSLTDSAFFKDESEFAYSVDQGTNQVQVLAYKTADGKVRPMKSSNPFDLSHIGSIRDADSFLSNPTVLRELSFNHLIRALQSNHQVILQLINAENMTSSHRKKLMEKVEKFQADLAAGDYKLLQAQPEDALSPIERFLLIVDQKLIASDLKAQEVDRPAMGEFITQWNENEPVLPALDQFLAAKKEEKASALAAEKAAREKLAGAKAPQAQRSVQQSRGKLFNFFFGNLGDFQDVIRECNELLKDNKTDPN